MPCSAPAHGNHYLEVQEVTAVFDPPIAQSFGLAAGKDVVEQLAARGIIIRSPSMRGIAEEAPEAYKDVSAVVDAAEGAGLARKVARPEPLICIKG